MNMAYFFSIKHQFYS